MICLCVNENSQVHPYLNRRLNDFQRLALITQFFTILGICQSILLCFSELSGAVLLSCARPSCVLLNSCTHNLIPYRRPGHDRRRYNLSDGANPQ